MCWDISLHTDIEIIKKTFPQLRDERRQLDYNYDYLENVQAITFPKYPILYKDKANEVMANIHNDGPNKHRMPLFLPEDLERQCIEDINEENMPPIFLFEMPNEKLRHYPVYTLRGYPNRPDGKHRYEAFG